MTSSTQMMWRLNFLVFFCCAALGNDYMLYYICPMHTLFTIMVLMAILTTLAASPVFDLVYPRGSKGSPELPVPEGLL